MLVLVLSIQTNFCVNVGAKYLSSYMLVLVLSI